MLKAYAKPFAELTAWLRELEASLLAEPDADISLDPRPDVQGHLATMTFNAINRIDAVSSSLALDEVRRQIRNLLITWETDSDFNAIKLSERLRIVREGIYSELGQRKLLYVQAPDLYEKEHGFGTVVDAAFNDDLLREDISEAGKCLALERNTAAVLHLMRVAEFGLRKLARKLKVTSVKKGRPLELADWKMIFDAVEKKLTALRGKKRTHKQDAQLELYAGLLIELRAFKDAWRDRTSHARVTYDALQARSIYNHVASFMQRLAERL